MAFRLTIAQLSARRIHLKFNIVLAYKFALTF